MLSTAKCNRPKDPPSIEIIPKVSRAHVETGISNGARNLLSFLILRSGKKGYCWWGITAIAREFQASESTVRRWKRELIAAGLVEELTRKGRSSYLIPYPQEFKGLLPAGMVKSERGPLSNMEGVKEKETKNSNVCTLPETPTELPEEIPGNERETSLNSFQEETQEVSVDPVAITIPLELPGDPETPKNQAFDVGLLREILKITGDHKSRGNWISILKRVSENEIRLGLSCLAIAMADGIVSKPGAYLNRVIRDRNPSLASGKKRAERPVAPHTPVARTFSVSPDFQERPVTSDQGKKFAQIGRMLVDKKITLAKARVLMAKAVNEMS